MFSLPQSSRCMFLLKRFNAQVKCNLNTPRNFRDWVMNFLNVHFMPLNIGLWMSYVFTNLPSLIMNNIRYSLVLVFLLSFNVGKNVFLILLTFVKKNFQQHLNDLFFIYFQFTWHSSVILWSWCLVMKQQLIILLSHQW